MFVIQHVFTLYTDNPQSDCLQRDFYSSATREHARIESGNGEHARIDSPSPAPTHPVPPKVQERHGELAIN